MRAGIIAAATLAGCGVGGADDGDGRALFVERAWPALGRCVGCHQRQPGVDFMAPGIADAAYDTMFAFQPPVLDVADPASSLLLTMGPHTGPALAPLETEALLGWLDVEHAARTSPGLPPVVIGPVTLQLGQLNTIDLAAAGAPGATLRFVPDMAGPGLYLGGLELVAGAAPVRLTHPLFVSHPIAAAAVPDPLDRFADVDAVAMPGGLPFDLGAALFLELAATDPVTIHARSLEVMP
jgi:hypothetical protein